MAQSDTVLEVDEVAVAVVHPEDGVEERDELESSNESPFR